MEYDVREHVAEITLNRPAASNALDLSDVTGDDGVLAAARAAAGGLAARPAHALGAARKLVRSSWASSLEEHLDHEAATIARSSAAEETAALISGFLNRG